MNMKKQLIEKIFEKGIDINQYMILTMIKNGEDFLSLISIRKVEGITNLMKKRDIIDEDYKITGKGTLLLQSIGEMEIPVVSPIVLKEEENNFELWTTQLLQKIKEKLKSHIGKEQVMGFGGVYFIPGIYDLRSFLIRFVKEYKINLDADKHKVERILINHVDKCAKLKQYSPAIKYFIIKDKTGSQLAAALENFTDLEKEEKTQTNEYSTEG